METLEIQKLIQQSRRQDSYAFSLLVRQYQDFVFRLAFRLLCNYEEAQDITQETFIRVWTHLPQFNFACKLALQPGYIKSPSISVTIHCVRIKSARSYMIRKLIF